MVSKKKLCIILVVVALFSTFCGFSGAKMYKYHSGGEIQYYVYPETGINYLVYEGRLDGYGTGSICPRYKTADGKLYVTEPKK